MSTTHTAGIRSLAPIAAAACAASLLLMSVGTWVNSPFSHHGRWEITTDAHSASDGLLMLAFAAIGTAVVFGVIVARALHRDAARTARYALTLGVAGLVSVFVFWTGLPVIAAAGAAVLALDARQRLGRIPPAAAIALIFAAITVTAATVLAFIG